MQIMLVFFESNARWIKKGLSVLILFSPHFLNNPENAGRREEERKEERKVNH